MVREVVGPINLEDCLPETRIALDSFQPRFYQEMVLDAWINKGYKKFLLVLPRRSGKDFLAFYMAVMQCLMKTCLVLYALPTYGQACRCVFDAISIDGKRFIDMIPKELVAQINRSELTIRFINHSMIKFIGADSYDTSLVGTNAQVIILSEAALMQLENVYGYARPILAANQGTVIILSTPRGKNAFWQMFMAAKEQPDWYVMHMGVDRTQHIDANTLEAERQQMNPELFEQEYNVSFSKGVDGQIYGRELEMAQLQGRIGFFEEDPMYLTHVAMDLGVADSSAVIFFQLPNAEFGPIRIIDFWQASNEGAPQIVKMIKDKPYRLGKVFCPHDLMVREFGSGALSRYEKFAQLGIRAEVLPQLAISDGLDHAKAIFPRIYINENKCKTLLNSLQHYHREYDPLREVYTKPVHDWSSNACDALRYLAMAVHKCKKGMSAEEWRRKRNEALYGKDNYLFSRDSRYER